MNRIAIGPMRRFFFFFDSTNRKVHDLHQRAATSCCARVGKKAREGRVQASGKLAKHQKKKNQRSCRANGLCFPGSVHVWVDRMHAEKTLETSTSGAIGGERHDPIRGRHKVLSSLSPRPRNSNCDREGGMCYVKVM